MQRAPKTWQACKHQKHNEQMSIRNLMNTMIMKNNQTPKMQQTLKSRRENEHYENDE